MSSTFAFFDNLDVALLPTVRLVATNYAHVAGTGCLIWVLFFSTKILAKQICKNYTI